MNVNKFFHNSRKGATDRKIQPKKVEEVEEPVMKIPIKKKKAAQEQSSKVIPSSKTIRYISGNYDKKKAIAKVEPESEEEQDDISVSEFDNDDISLQGNNSDDESIIEHSEDEDIIAESDEEEEDILGFESEIIEEKRQKTTQPKEVKAKKTKEAPKDKKKIETKAKKAKKVSQTSDASDDILDMARKTLDMPKVEGRKPIVSKVVSINSRMTEEYINGLSRPLPEETYEMDEFDLSTTTFKGSIINEVEIEGVEIEKKNYFNVISSIYEYLENYDNIMKYGGINVQEGKLTGRGFVYLQELDISVQYVSADRSIKEIFEQVLGNGLNFRMDVSTREKRYVFVNE